MKRSDGKNETSPEAVPRAPRKRGPGEEKVIPPVSEREQYYWSGDRNFSLYVRSCGEFTLYAPDREKPRLRTGFGEIFWPVEGKGVFCLKDRVYTLSPGNVWYYPPGVVHAYFPVGHLKYCWLTIAGPDAEKVFDLMKIRPGLNRACICPEQMFRAVGDDLEFSSRQERNALATAFKILSMISVMPPDDVRGGSSRGSAVFDAEQIIELNFHDPELTVEKIAAMVGLHRVSLTRAFRKSLGVTVTDRIRARRIKKAADLLLTTELPVAEIARVCGVNSPAYFSKVFRRETGLFPAVYRKSRGGREN